MNNSEFQAIRMQFIAQWGTLGSSWGINRTMAQIHALLMVAVEPMHTNEIMEELKVSRGNANTNLRELIGWGLIQRIAYPGNRKEYFEAEKPPVLKPTGKGSWNCRQSATSLEANWTWVLEFPPIRHQS